MRVPQRAESISEATVGAWAVKAGEAVARDQLLVELETDKVTVEVNAPEAGTLAEILAATGATVQRSEEHTSELQSLMRISYAVFCLKNKTKTTIPQENTYNTQTQHQYP